MDEPDIKAPKRRHSSSEPTVVHIHVPDRAAQVRGLMAALRAIQRAKTAGVHTPVGGGSNS